jgi:hypothetical protein
MRNHILLFLFLVILNSILVNGQVSTQLATITVGSPVNSGGLGISFDGKVMPNGTLFFSGSPDGLRKAIWKSNGTVAGTSKVVEEPSQFGNDWDQVIYTDAGVLVYDNNTWKILKQDQTALSVIQGMPNLRLNNLTVNQDESYYMTFKSGNDIILYSAEKNLLNIKNIGSFNPIGNSIEMSSGNYGAVTFNDNVFASDSPYIYLKSRNASLLLLDFIKEYFPTATDVTSGFMFNEFLFVNFAEPGNSNSNKIINLKNNETGASPYIRTVLAFHDYNTHVIIVTDRDVYKVNKTNYSSTTIFDNVFAFTPILFLGNKLYIIGREGNDENIVEINLDANSYSILPNSKTGSSFYSSKFFQFKNEFYYISQSTHQLLNKYNFVNASTTIVDTLSLRTGATVEHSLFEVNNRLVFSKRLGFLQHEPFVLGSGTSSTINASLKKLIVYPTLAQNEIFVEAPEGESFLNRQCYISDNAGKLYNINITPENSFDISSLPKGNYQGILSSEKSNYVLRFIKI